MSPLRFAIVTALALLGIPSAALAATADVNAATLELRSGNAQIGSYTVLPVTGGYLVRLRPFGPETLHAGPGCATSRPRELRCGGVIDRIDATLANARSSTFATERLPVPISVHGGNEADLIAIGSGDGQTYGSKAPVTVNAGGGNDSVLVVGLPGVPYVVDGGPGRDILEGIKPFAGAAPSFTLHGGAGNDWLRGADGTDELDGGAGADRLEGRGGADTVFGGSGSDTAVFAAPPPGQPRLTVTLDGQRNDGQPGENALIGSDVENVTFVSPFEGGPVPGGNTLIGNDGPNVLIGAGIVRGLGGNDVVVGASAEPNDLDGGDGNDRIGARVHDEARDYVVADTITCSNGDDTAFTDRRDPRPADCEHFNLGMHVAAATVTVDRTGRAAVRVSCNDIIPCELGNVVLRYKKHVASVYSGRPTITIASGDSAVRRVRLTRGWRRPGRFRTLTVMATPVARLIGQFGEVTAGFPRVIKLIRAR